MKKKPNPSSAKHTSHLKTKTRRQVGRDDPSEHEAKDFLVAAIEKSLTESLEQIGSAGSR